MDGQTVAFEDRAAGRRGVLASYGDVSHETRLLALERAYTDLMLDMAQLKTKNEAPLDVTRIGMSFKLGLSMAGTAIVIVLGAWSSAAWVKSDVRDIRTRMDAQISIDALKAKVAEEQNHSQMLQQVQLADKVNAMERQINEIAGALKRR